MDMAYPIRQHMQQKATTTKEQHRTLQRHVTEAASSKRTGDKLDELKALELSVLAAWRMIQVLSEELHMPRGSVKVEVRP